MLRRGHCSCTWQLWDKGGCWNIAMVAQVETSHKVGKLTQSHQLHTQYVFVQFGWSVFYYLDLFVRWRLCDCFFQMSYMYVCRCPSGIRLKKWTWPLWPHTVGWLASWGKADTPKKDNHIIYSKMRCTECDRVGGSFPDSHRNTTGQMNHTEVKIKYLCYI